MTMIPKKTPSSFHFPTVLEKRLVKTPKERKPGPKTNRKRLKTATAKKEAKKIRYV